MMNLVGWHHVEIITKSLTALCTALAVFILMAVVYIQQPLNTIITAERHSNIGSRVPSTTVTIKSTSAAPSHISPFLHEY